MLKPPEIFSIFSAFSSEAARSASLTAARTRSASISTSSGSPPEFFGPDERAAGYLLLRLRRIPGVILPS